MPKVKYNEPKVACHGDAIGPTVMLVNEAPGPSEAASGIPLYGQQGANVFHHLRAAGIEWACDFKKFVWPRDAGAVLSEKRRLKAAFLVARAKHVSCTNAYSLWPQPCDESRSFCAPLDADVTSDENLDRLRSEIAPTHRAILVCGRSAYLACVGAVLKSQSDREMTELTNRELELLNTRLHANFEKGWFMGHTRRWSLHRQEAAATLRDVAAHVGWPLLPTAS